MHPKEPQMSEGDKLERANNTLLPFRGLKGQRKGTKKQSKEAKNLRNMNMAEHAAQSGLTIQDAMREYAEDPKAITPVNAESIGRARRGEPGVYRTDKDLSK
jgi:hypothetical protein